ncbi:MAG: hypothetical protein FJX67_17825 [Alphaproteobacteria bacterium]|nr:hypothetical protein [Alphaproteobacteria bacterium]
MTIATIWISYDLGVRGDYEGLYAWLDRHGAEECGDSIAVLQYDHKKSLVEELKADLNKAVDIDKRGRIYVVYRDKGTDKNKGIFLFGARRAAPWVGYAPGQKVTADTEV